MYALDQPAIRTDASLENSVLKTLAWFDLFHYPLTEGELLYFLDRIVTGDELWPVLQKLCERGDVFWVQGFYALHNEPAMVAERKKANEKASAMLRKAHRIGRVLQQFPYVRAVCISGSLSKKCCRRSCRYRLLYHHRTQSLMDSAHCHAWVEEIVLPLGRTA